MTEPIKFEGTWTKYNGDWVIKTTWQLEPGTKIDVVKRDGTKQTKTIDEQLDFIDDHFIYAFTVPPATQCRICGKSIKGQYQYCYEHKQALTF